jgi:AraC family transcriptional regulator of adaptative response/methylated-DNA-[protein]-cysteine methyltransferase
MTTAIGEALVAYDTDNVCFLQFADDITALSNSLQQAFPHHPLVLAGGNEILEQTVCQLVRGELPSASVSVRMSGTTFQERVWTAIQTIPPGEVRTYSELAKIIGQPLAVRAVASACAKNSIALFIPCHRVVKSDGTIGGYRWGINRKSALLAAEKRGRHHKGHAIEHPIL